MLLDFMMQKLGICFLRLTVHFFLLFDFLFSIIDVPPVIDNNWNRTTEIEKNLEREIEIDADFMKPTLPYYYVTTKCAKKEKNK